MEAEKREKLRREVLTGARERSKAAAEKARERIEVPDPGELTVTIPEGAKPTTNLKKATAPTIEALRRNAVLDREEIDFLWWVHKSLMAFEEIARGARDWDEGNPPEQMTVHTEMADDRRPGFLHLRLVRGSDGRRIDLALPDLPGEWTTDLVAISRTDRFEFLKAAEAIWVVLDGRALENKERH